MTDKLHHIPFLTRRCMLSSFSHVWFFAAPWTVAHQAPLSMGFSRQECWSALPFPTPEALSNPGIKPMSLASPALANGFFSTRATYKSTQRTIKVRETVAARVKRSRQFLPGTCSQTVLYLSTEAALVAENKTKPQIKVVHIVLIRTERKQRDSQGVFRSWNKKFCSGLAEVAKLCFMYHHYIDFRLTKDGACCCCSVAKSRPSLCYPMIAAHQASLSLTISRSLPSSYPMNWWCHPTISSSVVPFSSCPQSFPASGSFPMSQLCKSGGQRTGASASALVLPKSIPLRFPLRLTGLISLLSKDRPPNCNSLKSFQIHTPTWCFLGFPVDEYKA